MVKGCCTRGVRHVGLRTGFEQHSDPAKLSPIGGDMQRSCALGIPSIEIDASFDEVRQRRGISLSNRVVKSR
jgi:hypothetical protein